MLEYLKTNFIEYSHLIDTIERRVSESFKYSFDVSCDTTRGFLTAGLINVRNIDRALLQPLIDVELCYVASDVVFCVDLYRLFRNTEPITDEIEVLMLINELNCGVNTTRLDAYLQLKRYAKYPLPVVSLVPATLSCIEKASKILASQGIQVPAPVGYVLKELKIKHYILDMYIVLSKGSYATFLSYCSCKNRAELYSIFFLCNYFNVSCKTIDTAVFVQFKDFVTINNYWQMLPLDIAVMSNIF